MSKYRWEIATRSYGVAIYCNLHDTKRGFLETTKIGGYRNETEGMEHIRNMIANGEEPCTECQNSKKKEILERLLNMNSPMIIWDQILFYMKR